jgi:protein-disulfide isomerase
MVSTSKVLFLCVLSMAPAAVLAQDKPAKAPAQDPSTYMKVHAPFAEDLVNKVKAAHNEEIVKLGIHAVPPGEKDNVIIANITPSKIGKKSSDNDMKNLATGNPVAKKLDKDKTFDLLIPLTDAKGRDLEGGFVVMEVPFTKASNEDEAIKIGVAVRDDLQKQIPSKKALYQ